MFTINGERWWVVLVAPHDEELLMPNGDYAIGACSDVAKTIYISDAMHGMDFEKVLCHEIVHAAMFSHNVLLTVAEEELLAEIISTFGEEIVDLTDIVFDKIRRGRY